MHFQGIHLHQFSKSLLNRFSFFGGYIRINQFQKLEE
jgi:hypothetical protein